MRKKLLKLMDQVKKKLKLKMMLRRMMPLPQLKMPPLPQLNLLPNLNLKLTHQLANNMPMNLNTKKLGKLSKLDLRPQKELSLTTSEPPSNTN